MPTEFRQPCQCLSMPPYSDLNLQNSKITGRPPLLQFSPVPRGRGPKVGLWSLLHFKRELDTLLVVDELKPANRKQGTSGTASDLRFEVQPALIEHQASPRSASRHEHLQSPPLVVWLAYFVLISAGIPLYEGEVWILGLSVTRWMSWDNHPFIMASADMYKSQTHHDPLLTSLTRLRQELKSWHLTRPGQNIGFINIRKQGVGGMLH